VLAVSAFVDLVDIFFISIVGYSVQLGLAVALLTNADDAALQRAPGPRDRGFLWHRPGPGVGGHRDHPAGVGSRLDTG
jgi:hypothetical protein